MDNKKQEFMEILRRVFSDKASVEALMEAQSVEEIQDFMKKKEVPVTQKDCEFLLAVRDKDFVKALSEMKSNEEVQAAMEEKGFTLSADECAMFRLITNKNAMEALTKARNTEEVRDILEENGITFSPETYSNLEWNLGVDVELSEDELSNVAGGGWKEWTCGGFLLGLCGSGISYLLAIEGIIVVSGGIVGALAGAMVVCGIGAAVLADKIAEEYRN